jgi:hypothetical protein
MGTSWFKTLGTPTESSWPEAKGFKTWALEWYNHFDGVGWEALLPGRTDHGWSKEAMEKWRGLVEAMVCYESGRRLTAQECLERLREM